MQAAGQLGEAGLVVDADQCAPDRPATGLPKIGLLLTSAESHPMVAFRPVQVTPRVASAAKTSTSSLSFDDLDPLVQGGFVVVVEDRYRLLGQDRTGVGSRVDQVHGAAGDLDAVGQRRRHGVRAGECGQQRRVGVDHPAGKSGKKLLPKDFHEAGRHHQIGLVRRGGFGHRRVPGIAVGVVTHPHGVSRHRRRGGNLEGRAVAVRADRHHPGRVGVDGCVEQRGEQRTGPGGQNYQPRRCTRGHTERLLHASTIVGA